jgi:hypothetical protein
MNNMKNKPVIILIAFILSLLSLYFFKSNWGIDYAGADLYILKGDNTGFSEEIIVGANKLKQVSRVERVNNENLYVYFQNSSDNKEIVDFSNTNNLKISGEYAYRYTEEEYRMMTYRISMGALIIIAISSIFYIADLYKKEWKRWQIIYYFANDLLLSALVTLFTIAFTSILGQIGIKIDNDFTAVAAISFAITVSYRLYELEIIKRIKLNQSNKINFEDLKEIFTKRKPELILISTVIVLVGFMPFAVILGGLSISSSVILVSIVINYAMAVFIKPELLIYLFIQGERSRIIKKTFFQKTW